MSQEPAPWESPAQELPYQSAAASGILLSTEGIAAMRSTRPWILFMAIVLLIFAGLFVVFSLIMLLMSLTSGASRTGAPIWLGLVYLPMAFIYIIPAIWMLLYCGKIKAFLNFGTTDTLTTALVAQRKLWRNFGIMMIILIVLYFIFLGGVMVYAMFAAAHRGM